MKQKMFSEELNIKSTTPGRYKWLFGAFGFWQGIDNTVTLDYFTKDYATRKLYDTPTYGVAFYHQSTIDDLLTRGLSLTFGIRYDYEHTSNDFLFYKETDGGSKQMDAFDSRLKFSQVTPKIALQYMFPSTGMLYATVTKGIRQVVSIPPSIVRKTAHSALKPVGTTSWEQSTRFSTTA